MKVLKFGGSSVGAPDRALKVIEILKGRHARGEHFAVAFSAYEGVTNELITTATLAAQGDPAYRDRLSKLRTRHLEYLSALVPPKEQSESLVYLSLRLNELEDALHGVTLLRELSPRTRDYIVSFGERFSAFTLSAAIAHAGIPCEFLDSRLVVITDEAFGGAKVDMKTTAARITSYFSAHPLPQVITGFIGATATGDTTTLGRGGSDYTAAIFGAALDVEEIEIWTDVNGMMTADPRKVPRAFVVPTVSYEEAFELCHFGAKVIYTPTLAPAMEKKIPIRILNTFNPSAAGTVISAGATTHEHPITGVTSIDDVSLLRVQGSGLIGIAGIASRLFGSLARGKVNIILISQASSEHSICFAIAPQETERARILIHEEFLLERESGLVEDVVVERNLSVVSIVGENMRKTPGISARLFQALGRNGVNVVAIAQGSSELNISVVVGRLDEKKALVAIHEAFFHSETRTLNVFLAGAGLIGGTLLKQLQSHADELKRKYSLSITLAGIGTSSRTLIQSEGLPFGEAASLLASQNSGSIDQLISEMKRLNLPSTVFVDCTASEVVAGRYRDILDASIPIVTPNKKAQSGSLEDYTALKAVAQKRGVELLFETSVGAALPVISTLKDLIRSGDELISIEAVLSGTLSFLFSSFSNPANKDRSFSSLVREAHKAGYTEPDPRDDLNGLDAARKLLILAREAGAPLELRDVKIDRFLPDSLFAVESGEKFLEKLPEVDSLLDAKRKEAAQRGAKLCYRGQLKEGKASLTLSEIESGHPFFDLSGTDNIIAFTTTRYRTRPLVVKGPGAGAEVTAAGVFADIVRVANYGR